MGLDGAFAHLAWWRNQVGMKFPMEAKEVSVFRYPAQGHAPKQAVILEPWMVIARWLGLSKGPNPESWEVQRGGKGNLANISGIVYSDLFQV